MYVVFTIRMIDLFCINRILKNEMYGKENDQSIAVRVKIQRPDFGNYHGWTDSYLDVFLSASNSVLPRPDGDTELQSHWFISVFRSFSRD